jgi:hypothetical protein
MCRRGMVTDAMPGVALQLAPRVREIEPWAAEVRIPHRITDAPREEDMIRLTKFYSETFWANVKVFVCHQARSIVSAACRPLICSKVRSSVHFTVESLVHPAWPRLTGCQLPRVACLHSAEGIALALCVS